MQAQSGPWQFLLGLTMAALWLIGLYLVLDCETLLAKSIVLLAMAPLSLELDKFVSALGRSRWVGAAVFVSCGRDTTSR